MYCKNCGAQISDGATVCDQCGKAVNKSASASQRTASTNSAAAKGNFKSNDGKLLTGVCAGLAKKFDKHPWLIRAVFIIGGLIPIIGWFLLGYYIVAAIAWKYAD